MRPLVPAVFLKGTVGSGGSQAAQAANDAQAIEQRQRAKKSKADVDQPPLPGNLPNATRNQRHRRDRGADAQSGSFGILGRIFDAKQPREDTDLGQQRKSGQPAENQAGEKRGQCAPAPDQEGGFMSRG